MIESVDRDITAVIITPFLMFGEPEKRWPIFPKIDLEDKKQKEPNLIPGTFKKN